MPGGTFRGHAQFASGNAVVAEGTLRGTHTAAFRTPQGEIPPSGNAVNLRYATVKRFRDGRLVSEHLYFDQLEFLQQLGALP
jgi:ketosteroid isomerase-like protein